MRALPQDQMLQAHQSFRKTWMICVGIIIGCHVLPKSPSPHNSLRLVLMLAYFCAWLRLCYHMLVVRPVYQRDLYAWMYEDAPPSYARHWQRYLLALDQAVKAVGYLLTAFIASNFLYFLSLWFVGFYKLQPFYTLVWWISLVGLIALPFVSRSLLSDVTQARRMIRQEEMSGNFKKRTLADLRSGTTQATFAPGETLGELRFHAGGDDWHWETLYKNAVVFGQVGSGKTVCVLNALLEGLVASAGNGATACSGLILDPKGDFKGKLETLLQNVHRDSDLLIIDPARVQSSIRWNPLDSEDDELELAGRFTAVMEALGVKDSGNSFWMDSARKLIRHSIALLRLTNPAGEPPNFLQIGRLASSFGAISERTDMLDIYDDRCENCLNFFADEWSNLADETRSSIQAYVTNMIDPFLMEPYRSMFSGKSTRTISEVVDSGKILYVNMPVADKEAMARTVGAFVKLSYFREVLKRPDKPRPSFFLCDEFQVFFTTAQGKGDADFFERSRQSAHVNIIATQNLPALLKVSPQDKNPIMNLMGNCATKIFLRNTESDTNEWASKLFGQQLVSMGSVNASSGGEGRFKISGQGFSASDQYDSVVRPERFAELCIPDRVTGVTCAEAIIHRAAASQMDTSRSKSRWPVHVIASANGRSQAGAQQPVENTWAQ